MAYSVSDLASKYETLWEQQDQLYCELSSIKKRQHVIDYSNAEFIKMEKELKDLHYRMHVLNLKLGEICGLFECLLNKKNKFYYEPSFILFIFILIITIYSHIYS
jgi:hypothetical protein